MIPQNMYKTKSFIPIAMLDSMKFAAGWKHWVESGVGRYHSHSGIELVYHVESCGKVCLENGHCTAFGPGDITITGQELRHYQSNSSAGYDLCLIADIPPGKVKAGLSMITNRNLADAFILREIEYLCSGAATRKLSLNYRVRTLFAVLLENSLPQKEDSPLNTDYVTKARCFIEESYSDVGLEIKKVAEKTGLSSDYLRHLFKSELGYSPKQYLLNKRIERVKELLIHSALTLKEIAELSGFANERYLCFYFRKTLGVTPFSFRETQKQKY